MKKIRTEYRRSPKNNRMILSFDEGFDEIRETYRFEFRMLETNHIPGLLRLRIGPGKEERRLEYDITSKQSLSRILELRQVGIEEIRRILVGFAKIIGEMGKYLLSDRGICLEPEYIYADPESLELSLCYIPGWDRDFCTELPKLLSQLLSKIDHRDREDVVLAYGLYQESLKENYIIDDLIRMINRDALEKEERRRQEKESGEPGPGEEDEVLPASRRESFSIRSLFARRPREEREQTKDSKKERGEREGEEKNARTEEVWEPEPFAYFDKPEARLREEKEWKEYFTPSRFGEEAKAETADTEGRVLHTHTVLLSEEMKAKAKHSLRSLDRSREDIALGYFPFVIGKQERVCDYVLHSEEVSRLHLRLDQDGEDCVVTDLNSLNGTKIGGRLLENEESAVIRAGDILEIAGIKYLFS